MLFAGHGVHAALPVPDAYDPRPHAVQGLPLYPAVQRQVEFVPVESVRECAGHGVQAPAPVVVLYVLSAQGEHAAPSVPLYPARHTHWPRDAAPVDSVVVLLGQAAHVVVPSEAA